MLPGFARPPAPNFGVLGLKGQRMAATNRRNRFVGGQAGADYVQIVKHTTRDNSDIPVPHPSPGYVGTLQIFLAGYATASGAYYGPDSRGGTGASAEVAYFNYQCRGDEQSFTLRQININSAFGSLPHILYLIINGGSNDGKFFAVGSGQSGYSFGAGGAPEARASLNPAFNSPVKSGAHRPYNNDISYSDSTVYSPSDNPSYGDTVTSYTVGGKQLILYGASSPGGIDYDNGTAYLGRPTVLTPGYPFPGLFGTIGPVGDGGVILCWKNDR